MALQNNAVIESRENVDYTLTQDEINNFATRQQTLAERETEIDDHMKEYCTPLKEELKSIKEERKLHARVTKKGYTTSEQRVFWVQDFENKKMLGYDGNGELVKTRGMKREDRQLSLVSESSQLNSKTA